MWDGKCDNFVINRSQLLSELIVILTSILFKILFVLTLRSFFFFFRSLSLVFGNFLLLILSFSIKLKIFWIFTFTITSFFLLWSLCMIFISTFLFSTFSFLDCHFLLFIIFYFLLIIGIMVSISSFFFTLFDVTINFFLFLKILFKWWRLLIWIILLLIILFLIWSDN